MKLKTWIVIAILLAGLATPKFVCAATNDEQTIVNGVYAGDIDLSGMTEDEANSAIKAYVKELQKKKVTFVTDTHKDKVTLKKLGLSWTNKEIVEEAVELGYHGSLISRFKEITDIQSSKKVYTIETNINSEKIETYVKDKIQVYDKEPIEPTITRKNGKFQITKEENGVAVNVEDTIKLVENSLGENWNHDNVMIDTVCETTKPEHTAKELKEIKDVLGTHSTTYSTSQAGRSQSLELSASRLNGIIIYPGETISTSELMGPRTKEGGYGTALGYYGTSVADTVGAGICQTATTLYDAALYAELSVVERYNHTMVVHYSKYAMDATIYAGNDYKNPSKDLKLKNDYDYPVYIEASASGGVCKFTIYGKETRASNREVKYISTTLEEKWPTEITYIDDSTKKVGYTSVEQSAYPYVKATLTKVVYIDGVETEREVLHTDTYKSSNKKVIRGTKKEETTAATTKSTTTATTKAAETTKAATSTSAVKED
jgi:vancomycin resistance protein YoaR